MVALPFQGVHLVLHAARQTTCTVTKQDKTSLPQGAQLSTPGDSINTDKPSPGTPLGVLGTRPQT